MLLIVEAPNVKPSNVRPMVLKYSLSEHDIKCVNKHIISEQDEISCRLCGFCDPEYDTVLQEPVSSRDCDKNKLEGISFKERRTCGCGSGRMSSLASRSPESSLAVQSCLQTKDVSTETKDVSTFNWVHSNQKSDPVKQSWSLQPGSVFPSGRL